VALLADDEGARVRAAWQETDGGAQAYAATIELREAVYAVMLAALGVTDHASSGVEVLMTQWAQAAGRSTLALASVGGTDDPLRVGTDPVLLIPDRLAHAAVDLVRHVDLSQLKTCPLDEGGCGWLFLDPSRNGSRRWCSMEDCGARAKARRLTARRRMARASAADD
jgi:predicted RNA-binding Zn ribbon-like protein